MKLNLIKFEKKGSVTKNTELPFSNVRMIDDLQEREYRGQLGEMLEYHQLLTSPDNSTKYGKLLGKRCLSQPKLRLLPPDKKEFLVNMEKDVQNEMRDELRYFQLGKMNKNASARILNPDIESVKNLEIWAIDKALAGTNHNEDYRQKIRKKVAKKLEDSQHKFLSTAISNKNEIISGPAKQLLIILKEKATKLSNKEKAEYSDSNAQLQANWKAIFEESKDRAIRGSMPPIRRDIQSPVLKDENSTEEKTKSKERDVELILANSKQKQGDTLTKKELIMNQEINMEVKIQHLKHMLLSKKLKEEKIRMKNRELKEIISKLNDEIQQIKKELGIIGNKTTEITKDMKLNLGSPALSASKKPIQGILKKGKNQFKFGGGGVRPTMQKNSKKSVTRNLHDKLIILKNNKDKLTEFFANKYSQISVIEQRMLKNTGIVGKYRYKIHNIKNEMQEIRHHQVAHYLNLIEDGTETRNQGLSWIIKTIWYLGFDVDMRRLPAFLDNLSVKYLFAIAKLEITVEEMIKELKIHRYGKDDEWLLSDKPFSPDTNPPIVLNPVLSTNRREALLSPQTRCQTSLSTIKDTIHKTLQRGKYQIVAETPSYARKSLDLQEHERDQESSLLSSILHKENPNLPIEAHLDLLEKNVKTIKKEINKKKVNEIYRISKKFIIGNYATKYGATEEKILSALIGDYMMKKELEKRNRNLEYSRRVFHSNRNFTFGRSHIIHTPATKFIG